MPIIVANRSNRSSLPTKQQYRFKKIIRRTAISLVVLIFISFILLTGLDRDPYQDSNFYQITTQRLDSLKKVIDNQIEDSLKAGWARKIITPNHPVRMTGSYWEPYQKVHDDVFVKAIVLEHGGHRIAILAYDLWIIHPVLTVALETALEQSDLKIDFIFYTATHTHNGPGGWGDGLLGDLVIGGNDPKIKRFVVDQSIEALKSANGNLSNIKWRYREASTDGMVISLLSRDEGLTDKEIRWIEMINDHGEKAIFSTYSAHAVFAYQQVNELTADYPGVMCRVLESEAADFSIYAAGAVGTHSPIRHEPFSYPMMETYGEKVAEIISENKDSTALFSGPESTLKFVSWPVELREPHLRISQGIRARPWLFNTVVNPGHPDIKLLKIGDILLAGLPVEMSGEFYPELEEKAASAGLKLMLTSFNGHYHGYVSPAKYYDTVKRPQTREMNWAGHDGGEYFVDLVKNAIDLMAE